MYMGYQGQSLRRRAFGGGGGGGKSGLLDRGSAEARAKKKHPQDCQGGEKVHIVVVRQGGASPPQLRTSHTASVGTPKKKLAPLDRTCGVDHTHTCTSLTCPDYPLHTHTCTSRSCTLIVATVFLSGCNTDSGLPACTWTAGGGGAPYTRRPPLPVARRPPPPSTDARAPTSAVFT